MSTLRSRGFTMVELLVTMAILGILAAAVMPLGEALVKAQQERQLRAALSQIRNALDDYRKAATKGTVLSESGASGFPPSLRALTEGVADTRPDAQGKAIYFLRSIPRDPMADPDLPPEKTWRLRSYASPPDHPEPGEDVFDVHSSSTATALDGSAYASW